MRGEAQDTVDSQRQCLFIDIRILESVICYKYLLYVPQLHADQEGIMQEVFLRFSETTRSRKLKLGDFFFQMY